MPSPIEDKGSSSPQQRAMAEDKREELTMQSSSGELKTDVEKAELGQVPALGETNVVIPEPLLEKSDSPMHEKRKETEDPFEHLPQHEADILRKQLDVPPVKVSYFTLYRYATRNDIIILVITSLCSIGAGAALPLMYVNLPMLAYMWDTDFWQRTIVFGRLTGQFSGYFNGEGDFSAFRDTLSTNVLYFGKSQRIQGSPFSFELTGKQFTSQSARSSPHILRPSVLSMWASTSRPKFASTTWRRYFDKTLLSSIS